MESFENKELFNQIMGRFELMRKQLKVSDFVGIELTPEAQRCRHILDAFISYRIQVIFESAPDELEALSNSENYQQFLSRYDNSVVRDLDKQIG